MGIPKQPSSLDDMVGKLSRWSSAAGGNAFVELCEIADQEGSVVTKLPTLCYLGGRFTTVFEDSSHFTYEHRGAARTF